MLNHCDILSEAREQLQGDVGRTIDSHPPAKSGRWIGVQNLKYIAILLAEPKFYCLDFHKTGPLKAYQAKRWREQWRRLHKAGALCSCIWIKCSRWAILWILDPDHGIGKLHMMKMLWSEKVAATTKPPDISMKEGPGSLRRKSAGKSSVHV